MQLYALTITGNKCNVLLAQKGNDYFCLECNGRVRVRSGKLLRAHFYHIQDATSCRQAGKSEEHVAIQRLIRQQIGIEASVEEMRFENVGRVADVAWPDKKLIFEVQCSPISQLEIQERNRDYMACGWDVIWILYDRTFNQMKLAAAEIFLQQHTHYYTDSKCIYDQVRVELGGNRYGTLAKRTIEIAEVCPLAFISKLSGLPENLCKRFGSWLYYTNGDYLWAVMHEDVKFAVDRQKRDFIVQWLVRGLSVVNGGFKALWHAILERSCR